MFNGRGIKYALQFEGDISSLPTLVTKFNGPKSEMLGQLIVTPEGVASKISNMKEHSHPG